MYSDINNVVQSLLSVDMLYGPLSPRGVQSKSLTASQKQSRSKILLHLLINNNTTLKSIWVPVKVHVPTVGKKSVKERMTYLLGDI